MSKSTSVLASFVAASLAAHGVEASGVSSLASGKQSICGSPEIWNILTADSSVEGVRGIKWSKIVAKADDHIKTKKADIKVLQAEIEGLDASIKAAMENEKAGPTTEDQLKELINAGVAPFGNIKDAQSSMCGKPPLKPRHPRGTYRKSQEAFKGAAEAFFTGSSRLAGDFLGVCKSMLVGSQPTDGNYCVQLCQIFMDTAQQLSDESVGALGGATAEDLIKKRKAALDAVGAAEASATSCEQSREAFSQLQVKIEGMRDTVDKRFYAVQDAEYDLMDAQEELHDLDDLIDGQQAALADAVKVLEEAGASVGDATKALKAAKDKEQDLKNMVSTTAESLHNTQVDLQYARKADKVIEQLRLAVEAIAEKMRMLYDRTALEPLRDLGIHEELDLNEYFHKDIGALRSAGVMRDSVGALDSFCKGEAKEAFDGVANLIDLSPLCKIGDPSQIKSQVTEAVEKRAETVKETLTRVKSWMDPFKGQADITPTMVKEFEAKGEPKGLRKITGVYHRSRFFTKYLKHWEVRGDFLERIAKLKQLIDTIQAAEEHFRKVLAGFKDQCAAAIAAREDADEKLTQAVSGFNGAADSKKALEKKLAEMKAQGADLRKEIEDYERALAEALKRYEAAKMSMVAAYTEATSFLETLPDEEPEELLELEHAQAHAEIVSLREELKSATMAYESIRAKLAAAELA